MDAAGYRFRPRYDAALFPGIHGGRHHTGAAYVGGGDGRVIIQSLYEYYQVLRDDPDVKIATPGFSSAKVSFAINLSDKGELLDIIDLRRNEGSRLRPIVMMVPEQQKRTSSIAPMFLCDNCRYVLGLEGDTDKPERVAQQFKAFKDLIVNLLDGQSDPPSQAVLSFVQHWDPSDAADNERIASIKADLLQGGNIVFMFADTYVHQNPAVQSAWRTHLEKNKEGMKAQCLITGQEQNIARLHPSIKGVRGAQSSGANIVSYNQNAFTSYGKDQSYNAPISEEAAFAYTTALNWLLASPKNRIQIGDATTVFWAEVREADNLIAALFDPGLADDTGDSGAAAAEVRDQVHGILERVREGSFVAEEILQFPPDSRVYMLGLSPNNSRLSVRFWHVDSLGGFTEKIGRHYADMSLVKPYDKAPDYIPLWQILQEIAPRRDTSELPQTLNNGLMQAIIGGSLYPQGIYAALLERIRANDAPAGGNNSPINYVRTAMIKACLLRKNRKDLEVCCTMNLNECTDTAYRLGRLFALLEKAQKIANPDINSTIRDRYFATASASPLNVFPTLLRLNQHHIKKGEKLGYWVDGLIQEVMQDIHTFPARLRLKEQGLFVLGYYHQKQAKYQNKQNADEQEPKGE